MPRSLLFIALACVLSVFAGNPGTPDSSRFLQPTELDRLLDASPIPLPANKDTAAVNSAVFQVQLAALSNVDSAQARKAFLEQALGGRIHLIFDPPYYKLRFGNFTTRQEAENELADLAGKNIQGFVVRQ